MKQPDERDREREDREWQRLLEQADLEMSAQDLAEAEARLRELMAEDEVAVRPEWVEATLAKAAAPAVVDEPPVAPAPVSWWGRVQHWAAAAVALVGLHAVATAATVTAVTVATVVAVSLLWPEGTMSHETMTYEQAVEILMNPTEPVEAREAAMHEVGKGVGRCLGLLADAASSHPQGSLLAGEASVRIEGIARLLASTDPPFHSLPAPDGFEAAFAAGADAGLAEPMRVTGMRSMSAFALAGVSALRTMPGLSQRLADDRDRLLRGLRRRAGLGD